MYGWEFIYEDKSLVVSVPANMLGDLKVVGSITSSGIDVISDLASKANILDVYTKTDSDFKYPLISNVNTNTEITNALN